MVENYAVRLPKILVLVLTWRALARFFVSLPAQERRRGLLSRGGRRGSLDMADLRQSMLDDNHDVVTSVTSEQRVEIERAESEQAGIDIMVTSAKVAVEADVRQFTTTVKNSPLSGSGYSGYPPGTVPGMRKRGITPHWGCVLTVVVMTLYSS